MAVKFRQVSSSSHFTYAGRDVAISFDDTQDATATPLDVPIVNMRLTSGAVSRGESEAIVSRPQYTSYEIDILAARGEGIVEFFEAIKKSQVRCEIEVDGVSHFSGYVIPGSLQTTYNTYKKEVLTIQVTDGFRYLDRTDFTLEDYVSFLDPTGLRAKNAMYTDSGTHILLSDFLSEAVLRANGVRREIGCAMDISYWIRRDTRFSTFPELLQNTVVPVGPLFGKTWGQILDEDICQHFGCAFTTYKNKYSLINIAKFREDSFDLTFLNANGVLDDPPKTETVTPVTITDTTSLATSRMYGTEVFNTCNMNSYRGHSTEIVDLTGQHFPNGDMDFEEGQSGDPNHWGDVRVSGTYNGFVYRTDRGGNIVSYKETDDGGNSIGNDIALLYEMETDARALRTSKNNPNSILQYKWTESDPIGSTRFEANELGALASYWTKASRVYAGYDLETNPVWHNVIITYREVRELPDGTIEETGDVWSYDMADRTWVKEGSGRWAVGTTGIVHSMDAYPFELDKWKQILIRLYDLPSYGKVRLHVSNPVALTVSSSSTWRMDTVWDNFTLAERQAVRGSTSGLVRTVKRDDIEGEFIYESPVFGSSSAVQDQYSGGIKRVAHDVALSDTDLAGSYDRAFGWKEGFYTAGEASTNLAGQDDATLENIVAKQLLRQTTESSVLIDLDLTLSRLADIDVRAPLIINGRRYKIRQTREDYRNNIGSLTIVQIGGESLSFTQTETVNETQTGGGVRTQVTFAESGVGTPAAQVQSDWSEDDATNPAYIKNKPDVGDKEYAVLYFTAERYRTGTSGFTEAEEEAIREGSVVLTRNSRNNSGDVPFKPILFKELSSRELGGIIPTSLITFLLVFPAGVTVPSVRNGFWWILPAGWSDIGEEQYISFDSGNRTQSAADASNSGEWYSETVTEDEVLAIIAENSSGGGGSITVEDEGTELATKATRLNFVGGGVAVTGTGEEKTVTITGTTTASGITEVTSDNTITGKGTPSDPLKVANPFSNSDEAKLDGIEAQAQKNVGVEFTGAEKRKLGNIEELAQKNVGVEYTQAEKNKLARLGYIEVSAEQYRTLVDGGNLEAGALYLIPIT